jgi:hypothetical protein
MVAGREAVAWKSVGATARREAAGTSSEPGSAVKNSLAMRASRAGFGTPGGNGADRGMDVPLVASASGVKTVWLASLVLIVVTDFDVLQ